MKSARFIKYSLYTILVLFILLNLNLINEIRRIDYLSFSVIFKSFIVGILSLAYLIVTLPLYKLYKKNINYLLVSQSIIIISIIILYQYNVWIIKKINAINILIVFAIMMINQYFINNKIDKNFGKEFDDISQEIEKFETKLNEIKNYRLLSLTTYFISIVPSILNSNSLIFITVLFYSIIIGFILHLYIDYKVFGVYDNYLGLKKYIIKLFLIELNLYILIFIIAFNYPILSSYCLLLTNFFAPLLKGKEFDLVMKNKSRT